MERKERRRGSHEMLAAHGIRVSDKAVGKLPDQLGYSLQAATKTVERSPAHCWTGKALR